MENECNKLPFFNPILIFIIFFCFLLGCSKDNLYAKDIILPRKVANVKKIMVEKDSRYIIKRKINLRGETLIIPGNCELVFDNGKFINGIIVGNNTKLKKTEKNIFTNCEVRGTWYVGVSYSSMFDNKLDASLLLKNLCVLSDSVLLSSDRSYIVSREELLLSCKYFASMSEENAVVLLKTSNPNLCGITFSNLDIELCNICFVDDFDEKNRKILVNDHRNGCTICAKAPKGNLQTVYIHDCTFEGGTPSSYFASSTVKECVVSNCIFKDYMADHAVYCSMNIESFCVNNTILQNVPYTTGLFKVRTSPVLKKFKLDSLTVRNLNGYLAVVELIPNDAEIRFSNIDVRKDDDKDYKCYGVCIVKDKRKGEQTGLSDAKTIVFDNCCFDYGYPGHPLVARGAGITVTSDTIVYRNVKAKDFTFTGGISRFKTIIE